MCLDCMIEVEYIVLVVVLIDCVWVYVVDIVNWVELMFGF